MDKETLIQRQKQMIYSIAKQQISLARYKKVIKEISDIQLMGILDAVNDEKALEQLYKFQEIEYAELKLMYDKLKSIKSQKEQYKAIIEAVKEVQPLDCSELFG